MAMVVPTLRLLLTTAVLALAAPLAPFAASSSPARVIDGDTIDLSGQRIRLHGIDTPEAKQTCQRDGVPYPARSSQVRRSPAAPSYRRQTSLSPR